MSGMTDKGIGWLPVEARDKLEMEQERASAERAEKLLALDPRARVLALLELATCRATEDEDCPVLSPPDLQRVLESFPGEPALDEALLRQRLPTLLAD
ncbi:hypothetical protein [Falsiroseomonas sp.]|uniref:hypothetical protein n=1 Tax=Falsiroseomonas sp. TaxID=2870721 RepID=UPI003566E9FE